MNDPVNASFNKWALQTENEFPFPHIPTQNMRASGSNF